MDKNTREVVLSTLLDIEKNQIFSNAALGTALRKCQFMSKQDRAYITRMVEGVTEQKIRLDYVINSFSGTKVNKCKPLIRCILRMGVYELLYMDSVKDFATCNECVKLAAMHHFGNLKGFVNGVLRSVARKKDSLEFPKKEDDVQLYFSVKYSVPLELVAILRKDFDDDTLEKILAGGQADRETSVRVNTDKISVSEFEKKLKAAGISVRRGELCDTFLLISGYDYIRKVPGYADGEFVVQDQSSGLAVRAAGIKSGDLVVDVCAAPGGKTMYAASLAGHSGRVISRDISEKKLELIQENLERLGIENVTVAAHDAALPDSSLFGMADVVIADLPCSGLGVMGRKNDIKYHVTEKNIEELAGLQRRILDVVSRYVKPGGTLVYSTCTIDSEENIKNAQWFAREHDFEPVDIEDCLLGHGGRDGHISLLQGIDDCDGFFIARFVRK